MIPRRDFLRKSAAVLAAGTLPWSLRGGAGRLDKIGVQLYTVRDLMKADFEGTLEQIARIGFREVEFAGYFDHPAGQVRSMLDRLGLVAPAGHMPYESLADEAAWQRILEDANRIGHRYVIIAWTPQEDRRTLDDWKRVAMKFSRAARAAKSAGLQFAYHNHEFEFKPINGTLPLDLLLSETDPDLVKIEMDLYWITLGGADPFAYFRRHPGRFPMVHVKDMKRTGAEPRMVDVGEGDIDFAAIFRKRDEAGIRHFFVEHDEPAAPLESIRRGYQYLRRLDF